MQKTETSSPDITHAPRAHCAWVVRPARRPPCCWRSPSPYSPLRLRRWLTTSPLAAARSPTACPITADTARRAQLATAAAWHAVLQDRHHRHRHILRNRRSLRGHRHRRPPCRPPRRRPRRLRHPHQCRRRRRTSPLASLPVVGLVRSGPSLRMPPANGPPVKRTVRPGTQPGRPTSPRSVGGIALYGSPWALAQNPSG